MDIFTRLQMIITSKFGIDPDDVTMKARFRDDFQMDSLDIIMGIMIVEEEFGIQIPDEEAQKFVAVKDMVKYIERQEGKEA